MELEARTTDRGGALAYGVAGTGPPVVLLHGWPETRRAWRHVWPALVEAGHRVIVPDLRGVGASDRSPNADFTWAGYADDLDAILDAENVGDCALVGHDMGGVVMFEWALRHPARTERIAALSTNFNRYDFRSSYYLLVLQLPGVAELFFKLAMGTKRGMAQSLSGNTVREGAFSDEDVDAYLEACGSPESRLSILAGYRALRRNLRRRRPVAERVRLDCPALVMWGTKEWALGDEGWRRITADLPQARVEILEAGHFLMDEQPERVAAVLVDFLAPRIGSPAAENGGST